MGAPKNGDQSGLSTLEVPFKIIRDATWGRLCP
jgi:hypothetical protein